jgi:hypothetical protein
MKLVGDQMTPHNEVNTLRTAAPIDGVEDFDYVATDRGNSAAIEYQQITSWPALQMTATWGS